MKIEAGKAYVTRNGQKVHIIYTEANGTYPVIGLIDNKEIVMFTKSGRYYSDYMEDGQDLWRRLEMTIEEAKKLLAKKHFR